MNHWAFKYIGIKHLPGGRTPDGVDCWGLVKLIYEREFGIELPGLPGIGQQSVAVIAGSIQVNMARDWKEIVRPEDGCAVAMSQQRVIHHVGLYAEADGGKIIHCWDGQSVIADTVQGIAFKGFQIIKFYRHKLWPTSSKSQTLLTPQRPANTERGPALPFVDGLKSSIRALQSFPHQLFAS